MKKRMHLRKMFRAIPLTVFLLFPLQSCQKKNKTETWSLLMAVLLLQAIHTGPSIPQGIYEWSRAFGGSKDDYTRGVASDGAGNVYVIGKFAGTAVDFDPGATVDLHSSYSGTDEDGYLARFSSDGLYQWTKTWGGSGYDEISDIILDNDGNIYLSGYFSGSNVDFDPGAGMDLHSSNGNEDAFVLKLSPEGEYRWSRVWGGSYNDFGYNIAWTAGGALYVAGSFYGTVDFDPGVGMDSRSSSGADDAYLIRFDTDGQYWWTKAWGGGTGPGQATAYGLDVDADGNIYIAGSVTGSNIDFDPGSGTDLFSSQGTDAYVMKLTSDGSYSWKRTVSGNGPEGEYGVDVDVDNYGNVFFTGTFSDTDVDFDSESPIDSHSSNGSADIFVMKITGNGNYLWTRTWGGSDYDEPGNLALDAAGNLYVAGDFIGLNVDFNAGSGVDLQSAHSALDADLFLTKMDKDGNYQWSKIVGGSDYEYLAYLTIDNAAKLYLVGNFTSSDADLDPGSGTELFSATASKYDMFLSRYD